jgi:trk system potassium uptake protein TrkH
MSLFDATCHAFTTMSTGGFSTSTASLAHWNTPAIQWVVIAFMFMAGINFGIYQQLITGPRRGALLNNELHVYALVALGMAAALFGVLRWTTALTGDLEAVIRASAFQAVSIGTTTGFGTEDFERWPDILRLLLLLLMFVGGCAGSTGGGMKVARLIIFFKAVVAELRRTINPRAVIVVRVGERPLEREVVSNVMGFFVMYVGLYALVTVILAAMGLDLITATSAAAANVGNIGPGLGAVGPTANYADVPTAGKWVLVVSQLLGRLELYSVVVLLLRRTWIK